MNISELSIKRPTLVVVLFSILSFLGYISMNTLNYELIPKFETPLFTVVTQYPGASPTEVENSLTKSIEEVVSGLPNVENIRSISQEGVSMVIVELKQKAHVDNVLNEAVRKIKSAQSDFPKSALEPAVSKIAMDDLPVIVIGVNANLPASELYDELLYRIKPEFAKVEGVGEVQLVGGSAREIQVNIDHKKLEQYKVSILQVLQVIQSSNMDFPAGKITNDTGQTLLRMSSRFSKINDIRELVVTRAAEGAYVRVGDLAEVLDTQKDMSNIFRVNGEQAVGVQVKKQDDANTVEVCRAIEGEIRKLETQYEAVGMSFSIPQNSSIFILDAANSVTKDLILAIILVTLIMVLFLHSLRNAIIVMVAVPLSLITSFIGMSLMGYTLNLMTLLALSLVIGTLVDDAIVVLENIYRHLEMGKTRWQATLDGIKEIGLSVVSITLVLVVVFFPVAISESIISPVLRPFAMVLVITILISLLVAFTVAPLLTSRFSKLEHIKTTSIWGKFISGFESIIDSIRSFFLTILTWALRHKLITLLIASVLFLGSISLVGSGFIGNEFISTGDMGECILTIEYPKDYTIEQNNLTTRAIEQIISEKKEVAKLYTTVGSISGLLAIEGGNYKSEINIKLIDKNDRTISSKRFVKHLEQELNNIFPGVKVRSSVISIMGSADENPIQIVFRGSDKAQLYAFANKMRREVERIPGTSNVKLSIEGGSPEVVIHIDKDRMNRLGLSLDHVGATIQTAFSGNVDNKFQVGDFEYDINVRLDEFDRQSITDVRNLTCINEYGEPVKVMQFADIKQETGNTRVERYARMSSITLESQALGRSSGAIGVDIQELLNRTELPAGVDYRLEGDLKYQDDAFGSLGIALLIAIFLVYLIMVALYESYLYPFVILFSIPLSIIGALLALALSNQTISIFSILGIIMLVGLVTKNAILVVDFTNTLRKNGNSVLKSLLTAVNLRLRPIFMTAVSTVAGMLPIALSHGAGSEWKRGLGWVLIGGMISSMLLTLIVVPVIYFLADKIKSILQKHLRSTRKPKLKWVAEN